MLFILESSFLFLFGLLTAGSRSSHNKELETKHVVEERLHGIKCTLREPQAYLLGRWVGNLIRGKAQFHYITAEAKAVSAAAQCLLQAILSAKLSSKQGDTRPGRRGPNSASVMSAKVCWLFLEDLCLQRFKKDTCKYKVPEELLRNFIISITSLRRYCIHSWSCGVNFQVHMWGRNTERIFCLYLKSKWI